MIVVLDSGRPIIEAGGYIFPSAIVSGDVKLAGKNLVVGNIRADDGTPMHVGPQTNIQDQATVHGLKGKYVEVDGIKYSVFIGKNSAIAHGALVHGPAKLEGYNFLGFGASAVSSSVGVETFIEDGAYVGSSTVGKGCHIGKFSRIIGIAIPDHIFVPDFAIIISSSDVEKLGRVDDEQRDRDRSFLEEVVTENVKMCHKYRQMAPQH